MTEYTVQGRMHMREYTGRVHMRERAPVRVHVTHAHVCVHVTYAHEGVHGAWACVHDRRRGGWRRRIPVAPGCWSGWVARFGSASK